MAQASSFGRSRYQSGLNPSELWGISNGPPPEHKPGAIVRSERARARRRAKRAAKIANVTLKSFLRRSK